MKFFLFTLTAAVLAPSIIAAPLASEMEIRDALLLAKKWKCPASRGNGRCPYGSNTDCYYCYCVKDGVGMGSSGSAWACCLVRLCVEEVVLLVWGYRGWWFEEWTKMSVE
ncbi:hypothetical protein B0J11DRAFT_582717 [Dendryphion nanum]|uniref:Uncharacterized protein n=1 Tax=Dendryphion nanum TaxID=256645 RepID=A0A9P9DGS9_9PLEO|nr:hypothetical protein B0J11DRAFT_582717 [Dendryphion nanum]